MQKIIMKTKESLLKAKNAFLSLDFKTFFKSAKNKTAGFFSSLKETVAGLWRKKSFAALAEAFVRWWHLAVAGLLAFLILYYPVGAFIAEKIDKNFEFNAAKTARNQTQIIETASALIDREVNKHSWTPNLPFFYPSAILDNMPAFQTGIVEGLRHTVRALEQSMPDNVYLKKAVASLQANPTVWYFSDEMPANKQYLAARHYLEKAANEIKNGAGIPSTALADLTEALINGLEQTIDTLKQNMPAFEKKPSSIGADEVFYNTQGRTYVYYLALRDIPVDFPEFSANEQAQPAYDSALKAFKAALTFDPLVVRNAKPDSLYTPNHLAVLGFYLSETQNDLQAVLRALNK